MISPELHAQIRRLFYAEHWRLNTIAETLGVHHDTVRRVVESERFIRSGTQVRPSHLDPYKAFIVATLEQYPRLRASRLWAMVRERGYPGSAIQVQRYVRTVRPAARAEAYLRLDTLAGEQAQVDWGHFGQVRVGATTRSLSCFVLVLSWSRASYARFAREFPAGARQGLRRAPGRAPHDLVRQLEKRRPRARRRSHPLPSAPARARRPLPLRPAALRRGAGE